MTTFILIMILLALLWRPLMLLALILLLAALLGGCSTTTIPQQLLTCSPQPAAPEASSQREVGLYIVDLAAAGDDCRTKLNAVRGIVE